MKTIYILPFTLALGSAMQAQEFIVLHDEAGNVVNGGLVVHYGDAYAPVEEADVVATLVSGTDRNVNMRRYELDVQPVTQNYFCWGVCYGPQDAGSLPVWNSLPQHSLVLVQGEPASNFHAYHVPLGNVGSSTYRYVWFDVNQPSDSVWVDIEFQSQAVSVEERVHSASLAIFPNPSKGADVQFNVEVTNMQDVMDLVVFNALGERVQTVTVRGGQSTVRLVTSSMVPGLYFASLQRSGTALVTQRFVVTGR